MKKKGLSFLIALMLLSIFAVPAFASGVQVVIDGQAIQFPDQQPYIDDNDRTLVPMRTPMEAIGCKVSWDQENSQATIEKDSITVVFTIGQKDYTVNGEVKQMDTRAVITGDRTCIPIRYAVEAFGASVGWDNATRTVSITVTGEPPVDSGYYEVRGYTIPKENDLSEIDTHYTDPKYPVIKITLDGKTLEAYQKQAAQARDIIASKHGDELADEMYDSLMEKEDLYQIINWSKVTPDNQYKVNADVCSGYAAYISVYVNR